jgi:hypothetical protein
MSKDLAWSYIARLAKYKRAFKDDILAEKAAVELYESHKNGILQALEGIITEITGELDLTKLSNDLGKLGFSIEDSRAIINAIGNIIIGNGSIQHIIDEEKEHIKEFEHMIGILEVVYSKLRGKTNEFP